MSCQCRWIGVLTMAEELTDDRRVTKKTQMDPKIKCNEYDISSYVTTFDHIGSTDRKILNR